MSDDNRPCIYCGVSYWGESFPDPDHAEDCPMVTGLFPVTADEEDMLCLICSEPFRAGDAYMRRPVNEDTVVIVCVSCAVLERPLPFP